MTNGWRTAEHALADPALVLRRPGARGTALDFSPAMLEGMALLVATRPPAR